MDLQKAMRQRSLADQGYRIAELRAKEKVWSQKLDNDIAELELSKQTKTTEVQTEIDKINKEINFKKSLASDLKTISNSPSAFKPMEDEIKSLEEERRLFQRTTDLKAILIAKSMSMSNPTLLYSLSMNRIHR